FRMVVVNDVARDQASGTRVNADDSLVSERVVAGILERFPRDLQEQALLRIHQPRFGRRIVEERRVEAGRRFEDRRGSYVVRMAESVRRDSGGSQLVIGEERDRFHASDQIGPEGFGRGGAGKSARHADDRDVRGLRAPPTPGYPRWPQTLNRRHWIWGE